MEKFKIGDRVERIGSMVPDYMKFGTVILVKPHSNGTFNEYDVDFGDHQVESFYETQLRLVRSAEELH